jgi:hypothetical protein
MNHEIPKHQPPRPAAQHIDASSPVLLVALFLVSTFAILCIFAGILLMSALGPGETTFYFFGIEFTTKHAGVAIIGLGATALTLTFRRVLRALEYMSRQH